MMQVEDTSPQNGTQSTINLGSTINDIKQATEGDKKPMKRK